MGIVKGGALRIFQSFLYLLAFCCAAIILGIYSYFLAVLADRDAYISRDAKAVEGISGAAVLYTIFAVVLRHMIAQSKPLQETAMAAPGGGIGAGELLLLGTWSSPWVIRVRVALGLKGLSYEYMEEDLANKSDLLLRSNPVHKKVPVLIHGGRPVCESLVILQYVDEAWPATTGPPLLPADPYDRATARFWAAYVNDNFLPAFRALYRSLTDEQRAEALQNVVPAVETLERAFAECSKGKAFFGGDAVGIVDIALGSHLVWIRVVDEVGGTNLLDGAKFPGLAAWAERFVAVDAVKKVMPDAGKVLEQYKGFRAKWIAAADST